MATSVTVRVLPKCDVCQQNGMTVDAAYDAKTVFGPWANLCAKDFMSYGVGLGTGLGQKLVLAK
jgi:hypothetical protein